MKIERERVMKKVLSYTELSAFQNEYIALDKIEVKTAEILDRIQQLIDIFDLVDQGKILMNDADYNYA